MAQEETELQIKTQEEAEPQRISSGVAELDEILEGGFIPQGAYLVRGGPGTGKTLLGLHFLRGATEPRKALLVTLSEPEGKLRKNAAKVGLDLTGVEVLDLGPTADLFAENRHYDIFSPEEVERGPITEQIVAKVETLRPERVLIDGLTHLRYLATDEQEFRRQALSLLRFLTESGATVLFTSEYGPQAPDQDLQFLSDGILELVNTPQGRTLSITKFRGSDFRPGLHGLRLSRAGMEVFPRLLPEAHGKIYPEETISSGVAGLDRLLHGGLECGTVTLVTGPVGVGKTTLGLQFAKEAATRGERSVAYLFEEAAETVVHRSESIGTSMRAMLEQGTLALVPVEALRLTADQFAVAVRREVEEHAAQIVMIDSVAGYRLALRGEDLVSHLHALTRYLRNMGVTTILVNETEYVTGDFRATENGISYLADNIVFLRYLEIDGQLRKALGVLKKRVSDFEKTLRQLEITSQGVQVGEPLTGLRGVLRGTPEWVGPPEGRR